MTNMKKITVSGTYRKHDNSIEDYTVTGLMPEVDEPYVMPAVQNRYIDLWLKNAGIAGVKNVRQTFIDNIEDSQEKASFVGKNVKDLTAIEIQDFAVLKGLMEVPKIQSTSINTLRERAIIAYERTQGNIYPIDTRLKDLPDVIVDGDFVQEAIVSLLPEDLAAFDRIMQDIENNRAKIFDLRSMCKKLGITFSPKDGGNVLIEKIKKEYQ